MRGKNFRIKTKKELILWIAAFTLSLLIFFLVFSSVRFLVKSFNRIFDTGFISEQEIPRFNLQGAEEIRRLKALAPGGNL